MTSTIREFKYALSTTRWLIMIAVAVSILLVSVYWALTNENSLRIFRIVTLTPSQAKMFYWSLATIGGLGALGTIIAAVSSLRSPKVIQLNATYALVPKASIFGGQLKVPYDAIRDSRRVDLPKGQRMIIFNSSIGQFRLGSAFFNSPQEFEECITLFKARING